MRAKSCFGNRRDNIPPLFPVHIGRCMVLIFGTHRAIFSNSVSANLVMSPVHAQSPEWTKVREGVLLRDNHRCVDRDDLGAA